MKIKIKLPSGKSKGVSKILYNFFSSNVTFILAAFLISIVVIDLMGGFNISNINNTPKNNTYIDAPRNMPVNITSQTNNITNSASLNDGIASAFTNTILSVTMILFILMIIWQVTRALYYTVM